MSSCILIIKRFFGTYYFGVFNQGEKEEELSFDLALPARVSHFEPREGVKKEEISLRGDGSLFAHSRFSPGLSLVGIDFKIPYGYAERQPIRFKLPFALEEMSIASPKRGGLTLSSDGFRKGLPTMLSSGEYVGVIRRDLSKGFEFEVSLGGLPSSSFFSLLVGAAVGFILLFVLLFYFLSSLKVLEKFI